jgi:hypothetical protein
MAVRGQLAYPLFGLSLTLNSSGSLTFGMIVCFRIGMMAHYKIDYVNRCCRCFSSQKLEYDPLDRSCTLCAFSWPYEQYFELPSVDYSSFSHTGWFCISSVMLHNLMLPSAQRHDNLTTTDISYYNIQQVSSALGCVSLFTTFVIRTSEDILFAVVHPVYMGLIKTYVPSSSVSF